VTEGRSLYLPLVLLPDTIKELPPLLFLGPHHRFFLAQNPAWLSICFSTRSLSLVRML
jgi:hypothetical protein